MTELTVIGGGQQMERSFAWLFFDYRRGSPNCYLIHLLLYFIALCSWKVSRRARYLKIRLSAVADITSAHHLGVLIWADDTKIAHLSLIDLPVVNTHTHKHSYLVWVAWAENLPAFVHVRTSCRVTTRPTRTPRSEGSSSEITAGSATGQNYFKEWGHVKCFDSLAISNQS